MHLVGKLFLEQNGQYIFGPGRAELLKQVEELGSLHKAAQKLGMSYRWAWGRLRDTEKALGVSLLVPDKGKAKVLSPQARQLLAWFGLVTGQWQAELARAATNCPDFLQLEPAAALQRPLSLD